MCSKKKKKRPKKVVNIYILWFPADFLADILLNYMYNKCH